MSGETIRVVHSLITESVQRWELGISMATATGTSTAWRGADHQTIDNNLQSVTEMGRSLIKDVYQREGVTAVKIIDFFVLEVEARPLLVDWADIQTTVLDSIQHYGNCRLNLSEVGLPWKVRLRQVLAPKPKPVKRPTLSIFKDDDQGDLLALPDPSRLDGDVDMDSYRAKMAQWTDSQANTTNG